MSKHPLYDMYINDKRMKRGEHAFITALFDKIQENNPQEIAALTPNKLHERLMELATELLNKNINPKANYWHLRTEEEDLAHAEEIVTEIVNDYDAYADYIDLIRNITPKDQKGEPALLQDLYIESEGPSQISQMGQEVRTFGAMGPQPGNRNRVGDKAKVPTGKRKRKLSG